MEFYLFNRNWKEIPAHEILERLESSEEWVLRDIPRIVYREYVEKEVLAAGYHKTDNVFFGVFEMYENARKDSFFLIPKKDITREDAETLQSFLPGVVFYGE